MLERTVYIGHELEAAVNSIAGVMDDDPATVLQYILYEGANIVLSSNKMWKQHANCAVEGDRLSNAWVERLILNFTTTPKELEPPY